MQFSEKLVAYLRAARLRGGLNLRGLPLIPKRYWPDAPNNRTAFNEFVAWIHRLALSNVRWVIDVGANHGDFAQAASAAYPDAHVLLVEPLPILHAELIRRAGGRGGRWQLAPAALGGAPGQATIHVDPAIDGIGSLMTFNEEYFRAHPEVKPRQSFPCEVTTLDRLCAERGIGLIDLLKLDVEGFEFEVLVGAVGMLPRTRAVIVEVSRTRHAGEETDPLLRMISLLQQMGLAVVALLPSVYSAEQPWQPIEFNLLARRP